VSITPVPPAVFLATLQQRPGPAIHLRGLATTRAGPGWVFKRACLEETARSAAPTVDRLALAPSWHRASKCGRPHGTRVFQLGETRAIAWGAVVAYKAQNLKPEALAALDVARQKSVAAMKKDDDTCHRAIAEGLAKAGIPMR
jgi:hypothetical protein